MGQNDRAGTFIPGSLVGESYQAFLPSPLPPDPPLQLGDEDYDLLEKANRRSRGWKI